MQIMHPPDWSNVCCVLKESQVEVILSDSGWMFTFLLLLVGRPIRQEVQQPQIPAPKTTQAVSAAISLVKIVNWDGTSQDVKQALTTAFGAEDYLDCIKDLRARNIEPLSYINSLDKVSSCSTMKGLLDSSRFGG